MLKKIPNHDEDHIIKYITINFDLKQTGILNTKFGKQRQNWADKVQKCTGPSTNFFE